MFLKTSFRRGAGVSFALFVLVGCGPKKLPPLDATRVFADLEKALETGYIFPHAADVREAAYRAAIGGKGPASLEGLVDWINQHPVDERRPVLYRSLAAFLKSLPGGQNTFVKPESLIWSKDPKRKAGVGLVIRREENGRFFVLDTLEGSASHRDQVRTGVYLLKVDGVAVDGLDQEEVIGRIKGETDTEVKIEFDYGAHTLVRGKVVFRNVLNAPWKTPGGGEVEYIALRSSLPPGEGFPGTAQQLKDLLIPMKSRRAIILDLRKLHLGDIEESFRVADLFVQQGPLGSIRTRNTEDKLFTADTDQVYTGPIYVIVGRHSSPLAQTLAMAIKNSPNVKLVGAPTDGAAFLATTTEIAGGIELKLTTGYVLDGAGRPFFETGLAVDFPVRDVLPAKPPLKRPDPNDPAQAKLAEILNVALR